LIDNKEYNYPVIITEEMSQECIGITLQHVLNLFSDNKDEFISDRASMESSQPNGQTHRVTKSLFVKISEGNIIGIHYDFRAILAPVPEPPDKEKANESWYDLDE